MQEKCQLAEYDKKLMQERDTAKYRHKGYKGNKTGNIVTGHILYREAEMTFSRKAFLKIFENKGFTQLVYR